MDDANVRSEAAGQQQDDGTMTGECEPAGILKSQSKCPNAGRLRRCKDGPTGPRRRTDLMLLRQRRSGPPAANDDKNRTASQGMKAGMKRLPSDAAASSGRHQQPATAKARTREHALITGGQEAHGSN